METIKVKLSALFIALIPLLGSPIIHAETTTAPVTSKPAVVTKKNPKTGDTSDVFVALGVLTVASAAAFVCLKKKKEN